MQLKLPQNISSTTTSSVSQEDPHPTNENYKTISGRAPSRPPSGSGIDPRGGQPTGSFAALTPRAGARAVGALIGGLVAEPERYGLDFAFPAVFLARLPCGQLVVELLPDLIRLLIPKNQPQTGDRTIDSHPRVGPTGPGLKVGRATPHARVRA